MVSLFFVVFVFVGVFLWFLCVCMCADFCMVDRGVGGMRCEGMEDNRWSGSIPLGSLVGNCSVLSRPLGLVS